MSDFFIPAKTKKGGSIRYGDVVMLTDETLTTVIGQTGDLVQHTGGFCTEDKIADVMVRPTYVPATMRINSAHVTNDKPDGVFFNVEIPVLLTCKYRDIKGKLSGDRHYEVIVYGGKTYWIHEYSLLLPEPFEKERMKRDFPHLVKDDDEEKELVDPHSLTINEKLRGRAKPPTHEQIVALATDMMDQGQREAVLYRKIEQNKLQLVLGFARTAAARYIRMGFVDANGKHRQDEGFMLWVKEFPS